MSHRGGDTGGRAEVYALELGPIDFQPVLEKVNLTNSLQTDSILDKGASGYINLDSLGSGPSGNDELLRKKASLELRLIFQQSGMTKADFISEVDNIIPEHEESHALHLPEPKDLTETYDSRNASDYSDPLDYLRKRWGVYQNAGILFQSDLWRLDPKLVPAVRAYCQRMARKFPGRKSEFVANEHLPPGRRQRTPDVSETIPGTDAHRLARMRAKDRDRWTRRRAGDGEPSPT